MITPEQSELVNLTISEWLSSSDTLEYSYADMQEYLKEEYDISLSTNAIRHRVRRLRTSIPPSPSPLPESTSDFDLLAQFEGHGSVTSFTSTIVDPDGQRHWVKVKRDGASELNVETLADNIINTVGKLSTPEVNVSKTSSGGLYPDVVTALVSFSDLHIGKNSIYGISHEKYIQWLRNLVEQAVSRLSGLENLEFVIVPLGNDLFNVDTWQAETTKGTPQQNVDVNTMIADGVAWVLHLLNSIREAFPMLTLIVPIVPGNHDKFASAFLGVMLKRIYDDQSGIYISYTKEPVSVVCVRGTTFLFGHGDVDYRRYLNRWAMQVGTHVERTGVKASSWNVILGHKHTRKTEKLELAETEGLVVRHMPSTSPKDQWHIDNMFSGNMRCAEIVLYTSDSEAGSILIK